MEKNWPSCIEDIASDDCFWDILVFLDSLREETTLEALMEEIPCHKEEVERVVHFLSLFGQAPTLDPRDGDIFITPTTARREKVRLEMNLPEWFALEAQFPYISPGGSQSRAYDILVKKFLKTKMDYPQLDLTPYLEYPREREEIVGGNSLLKQIIHSVEEALRENFALTVFLKNGNHLGIYPHRIVFLEGILSLIGEELAGKTLLSFPLQDVDDLQLSSSKDYAPNFSQLEVDDFILGLRAVSENEERIVLKILNPENANLSPDYHYFGEPYLATGPTGELIWGASVEMSDELFRWLQYLGSSVTILEGSTLKEAFKAFVKENPIPKKVA